MMQDLIAPELHVARGDIRRLDRKIDGVDATLPQGSMEPTLEGRLAAGAQ